MRAILERGLKKMWISLLQTAHNEADTEDESLLGPIQRALARCTPGGRWGSKDKGLLYNNASAKHKTDMHVSNFLCASIKKIKVMHEMTQMFSQSSAHRLMTGEKSGTMFQMGMSAWGMLSNHKPLNDSMHGLIALTLISPFWFFFWISVTEKNICHEEETAAFILANL